MNPEFPELLHMPNKNINSEEATTAGSHMRLRGLRPRLVSWQPRATFKWMWQTVRIRRWMKLTWILLTQRHVSVPHAAIWAAAWKWYCSRPIFRIGGNPQVSAPQPSTRLFDFELHCNNGLGHKAPPLDWGEKKKQLINKMILIEEKIKE